jgi:hypothetical protein
MHKKSLLAAVALMMAASTPAVAAGPGYTIPSRWALSSERSGGNKSRSKMGKERARAKVAAKSRRAQRKAGKR